AMASEAVDAERANLPERIEVASQLPRRTIDLKSQIAQEMIQAERPTTPSKSPATTRSAPTVERLARNEAPALEAPKIEAEALPDAAAVSASQSQPLKTEVEVGRQASSESQPNMVPRLAARLRSSALSQAI